MIPKLEEKLYDLSEAIVNVEAPDMEGVVAKNVIDRAIKAQGEFTGKLEELKRIHESQSAPKGRLAALFKDIAATSKMVDGIKGDYLLKIY